MVNNCFGGKGNAYFDTAKHLLQIFLKICNNTYCLYEIMNYLYSMIILQYDIQKKLKRIQRLAESIGITGSLTITYTGISIKDFDEGIAAVEGFERIGHVFNIYSKLNVYVILN